MTIDKRKTIFRENLRKCLEKTKDESAIYNPKNNKQKKKKKNHVINLKEVAAEAGINYKTLTSYLQDSAEAKLPRGDVLVMLAQYFGTTTDYLLGLSDSMKPAETEIRAISDYTGLSDTAIKTLHKYSKYKENLTIISTINFLLEELATRGSLQLAMLENEDFCEKYPVDDHFDEATIPDGPSDEEWQEMFDEMMELENDVDYHKASCSTYSGQSILDMIDTYIHLDVPVTDDYCVTTDGQICTERLLQSECDDQNWILDKIIARMSGPELADQYFLNSITEMLKYAKTNNQKRQTKANQAPKSCLSS